MSLTRIWCTTCGWQPLSEHGRLYWSLLTATNRHRWICPSCELTHDREWVSMHEDGLIDTLPTEDCPPVDMPMGTDEIQRFLERIDALSEA